MAVIDLNYGSESLPFQYDASQFEVLRPSGERTALNDAAINQALDEPIDSPPLEELINPRDTVLIAVPDATRSAATGQIVNLLVRRLIANGSAPHEIRIIFSTGIHRKVTEEERNAILTPFIAQRIKTLDHDSRDLAQNIRVGETSGGIPIELNRALLEHDHIVLVGGVSFHYFAGFTGGRKLVSPGLASSRTISATHKLAFDCDTLSRREGVDTGVLDGNAVHEAFMECVEKISPRFAINTIVNDHGEATDLFCGDWRTSHRSACDAYAATNTIRVTEKRASVIVSCGGFPHDINMIQAHKALDTASGACVEGGMIILLAECRDGIGRDDFMKWFDVPDRRALAARLCERYQVNGQTAWSLLTKAEKFQVKVVSSLPKTDLETMRLQKIEPTDLSKATAGYIIPDGAKISIRANDLAD